MKVMVIVKASKQSEAGELPSETLLRDMGAYNEALVQAGILVAGEGLHPSSKGVRVHFSSHSIHAIPGPFAETDQLIAGFWIWRVKSMDEAIAWAKRCPSPHPGAPECHLELRPLFEAEDFSEAFTPDLREQEAALRAAALGLKQPTFRDTPPLSILGTKRHYSHATRSDIPQHWREFVANRISNNLSIEVDMYGVTTSASERDEFDYLIGVEATNASSQDSANNRWDQIEIPPRRHVVFVHQGPIATFPETIGKIWTQWVQDCGLAIAKAPCIERYTSNFDPNTCEGAEIWIPLGAS